MLGGGTAENGIRMELDWRPAHPDARGSLDPSYLLLIARGLEQYEREVGM
jgi:hypothetical protein